MMPLIGENSYLYKYTAVKVLIRTICFAFPHWVSDLLNSIFALGGKNQDLNEKLLTGLFITISTMQNFSNESISH